MACVSLTHSLTSLSPSSPSLWIINCGVHEILGESERREGTNRSEQRTTQRMVNSTGQLCSVHSLTVIPFTTVPFPAFSVCSFISPLLHSLPHSSLPLTLRPMPGCYDLRTEYTVILGSVHLSSVHPLTASSCSFLVSFVRLHSLLLTNNEQAKCVRGTEQSEVNRAHKRSEWWEGADGGTKGWTVRTGAWVHGTIQANGGRMSRENHERREWASGGLFSSLLSSSLIHTHSVHYVHWVRWMWRRKRGRNRGVNEEK